MLGLRHAVAAAALIAATGAAILPGTRFAPAPDAPEPVPMTSTTPGWSTSGCGVSFPRPGEFELRIEPGCTRPWAAVTLDVPDGWAAVTVRARVSGRDIRPGSAGWQRPLLGVATYDSDGAPGDRVFAVNTDLDGTTQPQRWRRRFTLAPGASAVRVRFLLASDAGALVVEDARIRPLRDRNEFPWLRAGLAAAWIAWLAVVVVAGVRSCRHNRLALVAAVMVVALAVGAVASRRAVLTVLGPVVGSVAEAPLPKPVTRFEGALDREWRAGRLANAGHLVGFLALAFVLTLARPRRGAVTVAAAVVILAAGTELVQGLTATRSPRLSDLALDLAGAAIGAGLAALLMRRRRPKTPTAPDTPGPSRS